MKTIKIDYDNTGFWLKEFTDELGDTYILSGECSRCGQCCSNPLLTVGFNDENGRCTKLIYETLDGKDCYRCSIYENRPVGCVIWPREIDDIEKNNKCTFRYIKK